MFFDPRPWPVYIAREGEKIDFVEGVKLKSGTEMDRHSENSGDVDNEEIIDSNLLLPQITKYHGTDTKNLH